MAARLYLAPENTHYFYWVQLNQIKLALANSLCSQFAIPSIFKREWALKSNLSF